MIIIGIFTTVVIFCIPKSLEYTWKTSDIRTDYDLQDKHWTTIVDSLAWNYLLIPYNLGRKDHLDFLHKYRDITELGVTDGE